MQSGLLAVVCLLRHFVHLVRESGSQTGTAASQTGSQTGAGVDFAEEALLFMAGYVAL